jgi:hypothetical protein
MKLFRTLLFIGFAALPALLSASSPYEYLSVHVPFAFDAAGQSFPAGDYRVYRGENGLILIQGSGKAAATITIPGAMSKPGDAPSLKFLSDGSREHLVGVNVEGEAVHTLMPSAGETRKVTLSTR